LFTAGCIALGVELMHWVCTFSARLRRAVKTSDVRSGHSGDQDPAWRQNVRNALRCIAHQSPQCEGTREGKSAEPCSFLRRNGDFLLISRSSLSDFACVSLFLCDGTTGKLREGFFVKRGTGARHLSEHCSGIFEEQLDGWFPRAFSSASRRELRYLHSLV
jgi:hypothetical protein